MGLVALAVALGWYNDSERKSFPPTKDNSEFARMAEKHNRGWFWAQEHKATEEAQCEAVDDPDERDGCISYVNGPGVKTPTSPGP